MRGTQVRPVAMCTPILVHELAQLERLVAEAKLGNVLRHDTSGATNERLPVSGFQATCQSGAAPGSDAAKSAENRRGGRCYWIRSSSARSVAPASLPASFP